MAGKKIEIARQSTAEELLNIVKTKEVFGFIEHNAVKAPDRRIEYIGANKDYKTPLTVTMGGGCSYGDWADFKWLKANKPYMVRADGTPDYKLNENDYTKREDGTASDVSNTSYNGGAFSWAMRIYSREYMAGSDRYRLFAYDPLDGFEPVGFVDPDNNVLEGVWIPMFYGTIIGDKMMSIAGNQPCHSKTTAQEKAAIDAFSSRAVFFGGAIVNVLIDLMMMFAKTTDLKAAYGYGNCSGYDASQAPTYGVKRNAVVGGGQFYGTSDRQSLNKIFHSIVLGSYQQWMRDPYTLLVNGRVKVSKNYHYDITGETYDDTGINMPMIKNTDGSQKTGVFYPDKYQTVPGFGPMPVYPFEGSTATGGCAGYWQNVAITAVSLRSGGCYAGDLCAPRALLLHVAAGHADWNIACAVLLQPLVGVAA